MHGRPAHHDSDGPVAASHPQRWQILGVLVLSLLVTSIDHTIINVALPEMVNDLDASAAALQWIVAAYPVVFAGLLLAAGSLGNSWLSDSGLRSRPDRLQNIQSSRSCGRLSSGTHPVAGSGPPGAVTRGRRRGRRWRFVPGWWRRVW